MDGLEMLRGRPEVVTALLATFIDAVEHDIEPGAETIRLRLRDATGKPQREVSIGSRADRAGRLEIEIKEMDE